MQHAVDDGAEHLIADLDHDDEAAVALAVAETEIVLQI
jgi:hypothetical protein